jgi:transcriptional regulator with XRE-family HTH domain
MPAKLPRVDTTTRNKLSLVGGQIRLHRKELKVSATATAEAAGLSRVTLHRIEKGEPSVSMAAYLSVIYALGLEFTIFPLDELIPKEEDVSRKGWIPAQVLISDYPQLKQLAWQIHAATKLTPIEALSLYERNWRHIDLQNMDPLERDLVDALQTAFGKGKQLV